MIHETFGVAREPKKKQMVGKNANARVQNSFLFVDTQHTSFMNDSTFN